MREAALAVRRVHVRHDGFDFDALRDLSLSVRKGEILALVGPNGSGKSTLLSALSRRLKPRLGECALAGEPLAGIGARSLAQRMGSLPQEPVCTEGLRVDELVRSGRYAHVGRWSTVGAEDLEAVRAALVAVDLADHRRRQVEQLSGGERRRAWLAMALAQQAPVLLLDEPVAGLDVRHQWELADRLAELNRERGLTLVLSLHDLELAARIADRVAVLHRGRLYRAGRPEDVIEPEMMRDVFGVEAEVEHGDFGLRVRVLGTADPLRSL